MNAERIEQILEQLHQVWSAHVPAQYHPPVAPTALAVLILGIGIAVLGARLARGGLTLGLACLGGLTAFAFRSHVDWSPAVLLAVGMAGGALVAFLLFRLWIGIAAAAVCSALALGVYGSKNIVPHFVEYDSAHNFNGAFVIPEAPASDTTLSDSTPTGEWSGLEKHFQQVKAWCRDFWLYVQSKETDVNKWVMGVAIGAALLGFLVGSVLPRLTLIVGTACLGTTLVLGGFAALAKQYNASLYDSAAASPKAVGLVGLVLVATSLVLQGLLTRRPAPPAAPSGGPE